MIHEWDVWRTSHYLTASRNTETVTGADLDELAKGIRTLMRARSERGFIGFRLLDDLAGPVLKAVGD